MALFLIFIPALAAAQNALSRVWIDAKDPKTVVASFPGRAPFALFDARLPAEKGFAPPPGWSIRSFSLAALSPDGRRVAFKAAAGSAQAVGVYRLDTSAARILDTDCDAKAAAWSPDGRYLAVEDSRGLLNNSVRVLGGDDLGQLEISGDILAELGFSAYGLRSARTAGLDLWRTEVYAARWLSERALSFQLKRIHLKGKNERKEEAPEDWTFDVPSKTFVRR